MVPAAGAEAPALGYLAVGLVALLVCGVCLALKTVWLNTFGALFYDLGDILRIDVGFVHFHPGNAIKGLSDTIANALGDAAEASQGAAGYFFHGSAVLFEWGIREAEHFTRESLAWAQWMQHVHLPRWVKWAIYAAVPPYLIYRIARKAVTAELPALRKLVHSSITTVEKVTYKYPKAIGTEVVRDHRTLTRLSAVVAAMAGTLTWPGVISLPAPVKLWRGLTKRLARAERRLRRLELLLGATGLAAAMANVLGIANPRCLRSGPLGRLSRALCGLGGQALEDLLSLLVDAMVLAYPCDTMALLTKGAEVVLEPIGELAGDLGHAFEHCGYGIAPPLKVAPLATPPPQTSAILGV